MPKAGQGSEKLAGDCAKVVETYRNYPRH